MSDFKTVMTITDTRLFLRNYIYDEETLPIFESILQHKFGAVQVQFAFSGDYVLLININTNDTTALVQSYMEFISHPVIMDKLSKLEISPKVKIYLQQAREDSLIAGTLIDCEKIFHNNNFNYYIKL